MMDRAPLSGKVAWVTGSTRGIGRAVADELAGQGAAVAFPSSPAASGITGAMIPVDAGFLCR